jgi:hypothetical protein
MVGIFQKQRFKMKLLASVDKTPEGFIVLRAKIGDKGYSDNVQYDLIIEHDQSGFSLLYLGEDGSALTENETMQAINLANHLPRN